MLHVLHGVRARGGLPARARTAQAQGARSHHPAPVRDRPDAQLTIQTVAMNVPPQNVITRDNITIRVEMLVYCRVIDPLRAAVKMLNDLFAVSQAPQSKLRATLGKYDLDTLLAEP